MPEPDPDGRESPGKPKKKDKERHVWISFFGHGHKALAVLPLDNYSANPVDAYFADGMTEVLTADLAQLEGWKVISRTSTETYRDSKKPLRQIAQELNVDLIVEGSVTKAGDRVRVTVQLIDADVDGRYGEAAAAERKALAIRPQFPFARVLFVKALVMSGDPAAAVAMCDESGALSTEHVDSLLTCGIALHRRNDTRAAQALGRLQSVAPTPEPALARWYAATGELSRAFDLLARLRATGNLPPNLAFDRLFTALRADARYAKLAAD